MCCNTSVPQDGVTDLTLDILPSSQTINVVFMCSLNTLYLQQMCSTILEKILPNCKGQNEVIAGTNPACFVYCGYKLYMVLVSLFYML